MSELLSTKEIAEKWNIKPSRVSVLCSEGKIKGAKKNGKFWMIPADAKKPSDGRRKEKKEKDYKFTFIDLFAGIGGFHQAMRYLGGKCVMASEINQACVETYKANYKTKDIRGDIKKIGLMDFIERGDLDGEDLHKYLEDLLYSYRENQVDAAVLGCTHYPFARKQIQQVLGENVKIFDGGEGTAREMKRRLQEKDLLCGRQKRGQVVFENSLTDDSKIELCKKLLNI